MTKTVTIRERVTARQWKHDFLPLARRVAERLGLVDHDAYKLELELLEPINGKRKQAVIVARYTVFHL